MKLYGQNFSEHNLEDIYCQWLKEQGIEFKRQPHQGFGVDLIIIKEPELTLVELKLTLGSSELARGIGQLLYYRYFVEKTQNRRVNKLLLVSMSNLSNEELVFLSSLGIDHLDVYRLVENYFHMKDFLTNNPEIKPWRLSNE